MPLSFPGASFFPGCGKGERLDLSRRDVSFPSSRESYAMPFIEPNGQRTHYRWDGPESAPVLVFSNSLGTQLSMWDTQLPELSKSFRVLRYDTRGMGLSTRTDEPNTIAGLATDVVELLDALKIPRAHFCGLSMGGAVGIWLGVNAPDQFEDLILCNTAARIGSVDIWNTRIA